jgi:uncharacterized protein
MTISSGSVRPGTTAWRADLSDVADLRINCVRFGRLLREQGLPVAQDRVVRWLKSLNLLRCGHPADLYWSGRVNLVAAPAHLARYDELFRQFWLTLDQPALDPLAGRESGAAGRELPRRGLLPRLARPGPGEGGAPTADRTDQKPGTDGADGAEEAAGRDRRWRVGLEYRPPTPVPPPGEPESEPAPGLYSDIEVLREQDFATYHREDEAQLVQLLQRWPEWLQPLTSTRRLRPALRAGSIDLRRSVAEAVRRGGDPIQLLRRDRGLRWRKWVFLCDISASMAPYTRAFLLFLHAVAGRRRATEVFLFGTRLTRVTPQLRRSSRAGAILDAAPADWHGGTRLGEALARFQREYGQRGMAHGAVLFILSDGLDLGAPGQVGEAMRQLDRIALRIAWVNPLKRTGGYQPLARAMAEAMPYLDEFVSGHNLNSLVDLLRRQALAGR